MGYLVGAVLALGVALFASVAGLDRDRAFYPTVLIVIASNYNFFAVMGGPLSALLAETLVFAVFAAVTIIGFKSKLGLVAVGLAGHGLFDFFRGGLITNAGVPAWWPAFFMSFDVVAAVYLAWLIHRRSDKVIKA